jgi:hypothetical protein
VPYLTISGGECHPSRGRPPGDEKAKKPRIFWSCAFSGPYVDRAAQRQRRADFGKDGRGDEHENHGYEIGRPKGVNVRTELFQHAEGFALDVPYCHGPTSLQTQEQGNPKGRVVSSRGFLGSVKICLCRPDTTNKVQSAKARGKALEQVPSAM